MSHITIIIQTDGDDFATDPHRALDRVLDEVKRKAREDERFNVLDINGNTVASVLYEYDDDDVESSIDGYGKVTTP